MPLGLKSALPQVSPGTWPAFNIYHHVSVKQNSGERFRATWPSRFYCDLLILQWTGSPVPPGGGEGLCTSTTMKTQYIENTRKVSFDIKFTRQGFENAC